MGLSKPRRPAWARLYLWAAERLYHEFAWAYDPVSYLVSGGQWDRWRSTILEHARGPRVLELGYGTGALLVQMARCGLEPWGLERSSQMQRMATRRLRRSGVQVPRVRADAAHMPFPDGVFDSVVSTFPSDYIGRAAVLAEVRRVLRPGPSRLVVGGLLVEIHHPLLARLPWLTRPGATDQVLERFGERAREAGFRASVIRHRLGGATVPVFVLERADGS